MSRLRHESVAIAISDTNGTVSEVFPKLCRVQMDDGRNLLCPYRRAQVYNRGSSETDVQERTPVAVGDRAQVRVLGSQDGVVEGVADRRNHLMRLSPGREGLQVHVLASNVDLLVIVAAVNSPDFTPGLIDRFLVAAQIGGIEAMIVINKIDLADSEVKPWEIYSSLGVQVLEVSAKQERGVEELRQKIKGKSVVFCGHSGVGKTSLLRKVLGREVGRIGEINAVTGRGKHTTTGAVLLMGDSGLRVIDTPGVREFGVVGIEPEELRHYFPEFKEIACEVRDCLHQNEPGCLAASAFRHESYVHILEAMTEESERRRPKSSKPSKPSKPDRRFPSR